MAGGGYMTRALQSRDPRYARILGKMGYSTTALVAAPAEPVEDPIVEARARYTSAVGKKPFHGWDVETLNAKIAEHLGV